MKDKIKYIFKLSRPRFWLYLGGPALLGLVLGAPTVQGLLTLENFLLFLYFLVPANIMLYGINDYFDRDIDEENPKKEDKEEKYQGGLFTDSVIGLSTGLSIPVALVLPQKAIPVMIFFLFLSVAYSAPPFRFKARHFLDSLSNGLYILPFVLTYIYSTKSFPPVLTVAGGWAWTMAMHTFSAIPDIEPDRKAGIETTATFLGREKTYAYCTFFWTLSGLLVSLWNFYAGLPILVYPVLSTVFYLSDLSDSEAYWYYPYINGFIGMILTLAGLFVIV